MGNRTGRRPSSLCRRAAVAILAVLVLGSSVGLAQEGHPPNAQTWEPIQPDFSNVRGLNYIASYAPSDVAMWRFYDHDQIDRELGYVKGLGAGGLTVLIQRDFLDPRLGLAK